VVHFWLTEEAVENDPGKVLAWYKIDSGLLMKNQSYEMKGEELDLNLFFSFFKFL